MRIGAELAADALAGHTVIVADRVAHSRSCSIENRLRDRRTSGRKSCCNCRNMTAADSARVVAALIVVSAVLAANHTSASWRQKHRDHVVPDQIPVPALTQYLQARPGRDCPNPLVGCAGATSQVEFAVCVFSLGRRESSNIHTRRGSRTYDRCRSRQVISKPTRDKRLASSMPYQVPVVTLANNAELGPACQRSQLFRIECRVRCADSQNLESRASTVAKSCVL